MPVSRNLSLPASIEGRKVKKRQENINRSVSEIPNTGNYNKPKELTLRKLSRPSSFLSFTKNINNNNDVTLDLPVTKEDESNEPVAESTNSNEAEMGVDTSTRGGTLSQPCLPVSTSVGATQIFPHLYLGSQKDVVDEEMMRSNDITYVLNVSKQCMQPKFIDDNHFHRISVRDSYQEKMTPFIYEAIEFIEKVRKSNHRVLVHCLAGVSRSATVAIAYVLHYLRINFEDAYRFVKEKRPSISPNFNFLGQLMEYEKQLRMNGHMNTKRTGSLSEGGDMEVPPLTFDCSHNGENENKNGLMRIPMRLSIMKQETDCSPLSMPQTKCSFQCTTPVPLPKQFEAPMRAHTPTSSFCKRRNGPTLAFAPSFNMSRGNCDTPMPKNLSPKTGLLVDVRVTIPQTPYASDVSRRLGSDGNEMDEGEQETNPITAANITSHKSSLFNNKQTMDYTTSSCQDNSSFVKPSTAPNTPLVGRKKCPKNGQWGVSQLAPHAPQSRHRRCASGGGITEIKLSPLTMKRRFEAHARTERSASIDDVTQDETMEVELNAGIKRVSSFSGSYYDRSEPSTRSPRKFVSYNSRSPKILRQSLTLNLSPRNTTSNSRAPKFDSPVPQFDCTHMSNSSTAPAFNVNNNKTTSDQMTDDDTKSVDMTSMTISSPSVEKDRSVLFPAMDATSASSPHTCPVLGANNSTVPDFPSGYSTLPGQDDVSSPDLFERCTNNETESGRPFLLSASCNLKLRWRNKDRRRQSADSGYLSSSQASSQSSSSFTSPVSQQSVFGSYADTTTDSDTTHMSTCHVEGAFVSNAGDDVTNSNSDSEGRQNSTVGRRGAVEIMSCS